MKILEVMTEHTAPFKTLIEVLKELLPETNIIFMSDGDSVKKETTENENEFVDDTATTTELDTITEKKNNGTIRIMALDTTKAVLIHLKLNNFTVFNCKRKKIVIGVNLTWLYKIIKTMDKDENLTMYIDHDDIDHLKIRMDNPDAKKESEYELKLMDLEEKILSVPPMLVDVEITMNSNEFHKICKEMDSIAEHVEIKCTNNQVVFTCKGETAKRSLTYKHDKDNKSSNNFVSINIPGSDKDPKKEKQVIVQGIYELKNLLLFSKCHSLCSSMQIFMRNDKPLIIRYTVATIGKLNLCLSPSDERISKNNVEDAEDVDDDDDDNIKIKK